MRGVKKIYKTWRRSPNVTRDENGETTALPRAGDIVVTDFPGATGTKRRPAVVLSSDRYHETRPDSIIGVITSNLSADN